jgi:RNA polymerase sigma-70 factor, ECF subfamily
MWEWPTSSDPHRTLGHGRRQPRPGRARRVTRTRSASERIRALPDRGRSRPTPNSWSPVHRDVRADAAGLAGLRAAVLSMTASAPPARPEMFRQSGEPLAPPPAAAGEAEGWSPRRAGQSGARPAPGADPRRRRPAGGERSAEPGAQDPESLRMLALVRLAQDGDGEAFGQLYDAYSDTVFRYIYYRVSNRSLAEDLASETFLRALRRISTFTWQGRDFGAWLVTIARNLVADHFKSSRYRLEVPTGEMLDSDETEGSPEDSVLAYLSNKALLDAVCQLNPQQQECVTLRFLHGLSVAETARIMGKNDGAVKTLQYRAIRTLARLLPADVR